MLNKEILFQHLIIANGLIKNIEEYKELSHLSRQHCKPLMFHATKQLNRGIVWN
jgi:hypothetical protein